MHTASITVLDRTGLHAGVWTPPPSKQPRRRLAPKFDRSAIMLKAWSDYRLAEKRGWTEGKFDRKRWSFCLTNAWLFAKGAIEQTARLAALVPAPKIITDPLTLARLAAIRAELIVLEYTDIVSARHVAREGELRAELSRLTA